MIKISDTQGIPRFSESILGVVYTKNPRVSQVVRLLARDRNSKNFEISKIPGRREIGGISHFSDQKHLYSREKALVETLRDFWIFRRKIRKRLKIKTKSHEISKKFHAFWNSLMKRNFTKNSIEIFSKKNSNPSQA